MRIAILVLVGIVYSILIYGTYLWFTQLTGIHPVLSIATAISVTLIAIETIKESP